MFNAGLNIAHELYKLFPPDISTFPAHHLSEKRGIDRAFRRPAKVTAALPLRCGAPRERLRTYGYENKDYPNSIA
jgi:hypothetical protein